MRAWRMVEPPMPRPPAAFKLHLRTCSDAGVPEQTPSRRATGIFHFRADADYRDPLAAAAVRPFAAVHRWRENGLEKTLRETVARLPHRYTIEAGAAPEMIAVEYAMPAQ